MNTLIKQLIQKLSTRTEPSSQFSCSFLSGVLILFFTTTTFADDILRLQIEGQSSGVIDIRLKEDLAPQHVKRIKRLTTEKLYDGVVFHRVIPNFMAQTGDVQYGNITSFQPSLVGMGSSNHPMLAAEFSELPFVEGTVGMARSQHPNSANSQFFIMFAPASHLNGKYTIVGDVVVGMNIVHAIKKGGRSNNGSVDSPDYIVKAEIIDSN
jgi:cyclophilin family peptidyl-prolyl cis-trans isomerase